MLNSPLLSTLPAFGYDSSLYELSPKSSSTEAPWTQADLRLILQERAVWEKTRREVHVYYYRINQTIAYPLPVKQRPAALPAGIPGRNWYPWLIWLLWTLEERWRTLHAAWRLLDDQAAGDLLQQELAALQEWTTFTNWNQEVGLPTGHIAGCLTYFLADAEGWDITLYAQAKAAAVRLVEQDLWPWFLESWATKEPLSPHDIHNIPVIALVRGAQLARAVESPHADELEVKALATLRAWWHYRQQPTTPHTEGAAYDGYLMDTFTDWLDGLPDRQALVVEGQPAFVSLARQWIHSTLPGRFDLHAPLSDVEPEMPFWMSCLLRMVTWYGAVATGTSTDPTTVDAEMKVFQEGWWLLQRVPPVRLPAAALTLAMTHPALTPAPTSSTPVPLPPTTPQEIANAVTLRTGWEGGDLLALIGLSRSEMSHLHNDGGHLILGWQRRFWITDPGYQQYRPGEERTFTMGEAAHNAPVIDGIMQSRRHVRLLDLTTTGAGEAHATLDLTDCYTGLPAAATVQRTIWLHATGPLGGPLVIVRDLLQGLPADTEVRTHWQGGTHLAWAFVDAWARMSDGQHALWIGTTPGQLEAMLLERHAGSRGPLTLMHTAPLAADGVRWWIFCADPSLGWRPPELSALPIIGWA